MARGWGIVNKWAGAIRQTLKHPLTLHYRWTVANHGATLDWLGRSKSWVRVNEYKAARWKQQTNKLGFRTDYCCTLIMKCFSGVHVLHLRYFRLVSDVPYHMKSYNYVKIRHDSDVRWNKLVAGSKGCSCSGVFRSCCLFYRMLFSVSLIEIDGCCTHRRPFLYPHYFFHLLFSIATCWLLHVCAAKVPHIEQELICWGHWDLHAGLCSVRDSFKTLFTLHYHSEGINICLVLFNIVRLGEMLTWQTVIEPN